MFLCRTNDKGRGEKITPLAKVIIDTGRSETKRGRD